MLNHLVSSGATRNAEVVIEPYATPAEQTSTNEYVLEMHDLKFSYGNQQVLDIEHLAIEEDKITALIGASGSGKSTLLRTFNLIYQLYPGQLATGRVLFKGQNILTDKVDLNQLRKNIGMVFQKPSPFPLSIYENITFAIKLHERLPKTILKVRVEDALRKAALWDEVKDVLKKPASQLSGGQQQRLCIARAIATGPQVLLLDEPTSALDPQSSKHIEQLITTLKEHVTIVLVTHNLQQARRIADKTAFLHQGQLVEMAPTKQLFTNAKETLTQAYISSGHDAH